MSFNEFIIKYELNNKATSTIENPQNLSSLSLNDVAIYLRGGPFKNDIGIVNLNQ